VKKPTVWLRWKLRSPVLWDKYGNMIHPQWGRLRPLFPPRWPVVVPPPLNVVDPPDV
jgi:hypothetical protein